MNRSDNNTTRVGAKIINSTRPDDKWNGPLYSVELSFYDGGLRAQFMVHGGSDFWEKLATACIDCVDYLHNDRDENGATIIEIINSQVIFTVDWYDCMPSKMSYYANASDCVGAFRDAARLLRAIGK